MNLSAEHVDGLAAETGFRPETLEKVIRMGELAADIGRHRLLSRVLGLKGGFALWTRSMVRELIREQLGVRLSDVSVGRLLKKLGLSPQKPLRRAYEQNPELVEGWLAEDFPKIQALAKKGAGDAVFCGRSWGALGFSQWHDVGAEGANADCRGDGPALWRAHDFGDQPARRYAFYDH